MWLWFGLLGSLRSEGGRRGVSQVRHAELGEITACTATRIGKSKQFMANRDNMGSDKKWILA